MRRLFLPLLLHPLLPPPRTPPTQNHSHTRKTPKSKIFSEFFPATSSLGITFSAGSSYVIIFLPRHVHFMQVSFEWARHYGVGGGKAFVSPGNEGVGKAKECLLWELFVFYVVIYVGGGKSAIVGGGNEGVGRASAGRGKRRRREGETCRLVSGSVGYCGAVQGSARWCRVMQGRAG